MKCSGIIFEPFFYSCPRETCSISKSPYYFSKKEESCRPRRTENFFPRFLSRVRLYTKFHYKTLFGIHICIYIACFVDLKILCIREHISHKYNMFLYQDRIEVKLIRHSLLGIFRNDDGTTLTSQNFFLLFIRHLECIRIN